MKTIIAGIDFTPSSANACQYAAMLAGKLKCKLTLFNLFEAPVLHSNNGLYFIAYNAVKETSQENMRKAVETIKKQFPGLHIEEFISTGSFKQQIERFIAKHNVQAVVLGLAVKTRLSRYIYGSHSTDLAGKVNAPVIVVPERYKKHQLKSVVLGIDNTGNLTGEPLKTFGDLTSALKASVRPIHVRTREEVLQPFKIEQLVIGKPLKIQTSFGRDIADGLNQYCRKNQCDMVAVISRSHSAIYNLFAESNTRKIAFVSKVPVMAIHE